jgi:undecaprenyl-phosphate galactose phosphotransferase
MYLDAEARLAKVLSDSPDRRQEWDRFFKLRDDPRVTPIGRVLRRTSLDELPQLLNVILGAMSLVGPRPLPEYHFAEVKEPWRTDYLDVLPGMTGAWQVAGRSNSDLTEMGVLNSWYARNWSLWLDMTLLLRTLPVVCLGRGAY